MMRRLLTIRMGGPPVPVLTCLGRCASAKELLPGASASEVALVCAIAGTGLSGRVAGLGTLSGRFDSSSAFGGSAVGGNRWSVLWGIGAGGSRNRDGGPSFSPPVRGVGTAVPSGGNDGGGSDGGGTHRSAGRLSVEGRDGSGALSFGDCFSAPPTGSARSGSADGGVSDEESLRRRGAGGKVSPDFSASDIGGSPGRRRAPGGRGSCGARAPGGGTGQCDQSGRNGHGCQQV